MLTLSCLSLIVSFALNRAAMLGGIIFCSKSSLDKSLMVAVNSVSLWMTVSEIVIRHLNSTPFYMRMNKNAAAVSDL